MSGEEVVCQKEEKAKDGEEEEEEEKEKGRMQENEVVAEEVPRVVSRFLCEEGK